MTFDRVPRSYTYLLLAMWVLAMCTIALYQGPMLAVQVTAGSLVVFALMRGVLPNGMIPSVRGRLFDVVALLLGAAALLALMSVADTPMTN